MGEIITGILLGPTILGRVMPAGYEALFPRELIQQNMLETVSWLGVLFLLLATGFEVSISSVLKQGTAVVTVGVVGVTIPIALGAMVFCWFPSEFWGPNANRLTFTLFLSTAAAISAIPIIAKVLHDLEILKSDLGLTTLSAFIVNDMLGWIVFTLVLGLAAERQANLSATLRVFFEMVVWNSVSYGRQQVRGRDHQVRKTDLTSTPRDHSKRDCLPGDDMRGHNSMDRYPCHSGFLSGGNHGREHNRNI